MAQKHKFRKCKCGEEVPFGRSRSRYCSEECYDKYGSRRAWCRDMSIESKINNVKKCSRWAQSLTTEQLWHWYSIKEQKPISSIDKDSHGETFFNEFDKEYGLMYPEIVGLMIRLQRHEVNIK